MQKYIRTSGITATAALVLLAALGSIAALPGSAAAQTKFAFINSQQILAVAPGRAEAEAAFQKEVDNVRSEEKAMSDSLQQMIQAYQNVEATLSPADKTSRETAIRAKQASFQQRQQQLEQSAQQKQAELIQPIFDKINKVLSDVRVEDNYTAIMDVNPGNGGGTVVAYDKNLDITDRIIARVKSAPPVASGGGPTSTPGGGTGVKPKGPASSGTTSGVTRPPSQ
jgi:outer membrane protein